MLTILSRSSKLAQVQVHEVMQALPGVPWQLQLCSSFGDRHKELSLLDNQSADFFTDEIDRALLCGNGDAAIHSAKDLPYPLAAGLELAALTAAHDQSDALVSRRGDSLATLPAGACIGTSSATRADYIRAQRQDLQVKSIRGTIEERLEQVDKGDYDAVIVATCALNRLGLTNRIVQILKSNTHPLQGSLAVVVRSGSPRLRALFAPLDSRNHFGKVWLVGGGPGDASLLTQRSAALLREADIVYYDDLLDPAILESVSGETFYVGKRSGNHSTAQNEINELLYKAAHAQKRVVRLKGGDPFIFGRGGEEFAYLQARFIPVEVVPGISSFQAAAAEYAIPLTHRGLASEIRLLSGHHAAETLARTPIVAVFMGAASKDGVAEQLKHHGLTNETSIALIRAASTPASSASICCLADLPSSNASSPLMMIAGDSVAKRPLPPRILYTGLDRNECLLDGVVVHYPLIAVRPHPFLLPESQKYTGVIFTSRTAVETVLSRYQFPHHRLLAVGPRTAAAIRRFCYRDVVLPNTYDSDGLMSYVAEHPGRYLYPHSSRSHNALLARPEVEGVDVYAVEPQKQPLVDLTGFSAIVFTSSSTVDSFFTLYTHIPATCLVYAAGKFTHSRLVAQGVDPATIINRAW